jgi:hypothetical protein
LAEQQFNYQELNSEVFPVQNLINKHLPPTESTKQCLGVCSQEKYAVGFDESVPTLAIHASSKTGKKSRKRRAKKSKFVSSFTFHMLRNFFAEMTSLIFNPKNLLLFLFRKK